MLGDFPVFVNTTKRLKLHIPSRINDELKWLSRGTNPDGNRIRSRKLEHRCEQAYRTVVGWGYIGSKYVYKGN